MPIRTYRDLVVWQKSFRFAIDIYRLTVVFPKHEQFGITSQLRRAATSIATNIAEGHGRETRGEFRNQLSVAHGSANESETLLLLSRELGYGDQAALDQLLSQLNEALRMLARMRSRLREGPGRHDPLTLNA